MSSFKLPELPYSMDALAPVISKETLEYHYGKHHKAYVDKLNELIEGTAYAGMTIEEIVKKSAKDEKGKAIFNNAAQSWNHDFYWQSMTAKGGAPAGKIKKAKKRAKYQKLCASTASPSAPTSTPSSPRAR